ncbi:uncharacterized protein BDR25DRAFT_4058 [Lindgomyces ingoldianus]|uniref:Uncharacterized protein n=1 Tax=Lindgomyces ingoldianus TaxID=673940 RepID=A0ACB6REW4_9PLEO|nr:uncharacterized protein BDR25DRAFT_4058 [Lindgomyces ingoldianus]KAF2477804.1 hypothetical protein BDR25DRAFT_4058 [Lindgomyces ingoldianus]
MATPQDLTTTVSGRRCTRSRARTATSTLSSAAAETTELTSSSSTAPALQLASSIAEASLPSSSAADIVSTTATSSSVPGTEGTDNPVSLAAVSSVVQSSVLANLVPSPPAALAPNPGVAVSQTRAVAEPTTPAENSTPSSPTSSDPINPAATSITTSITPNIPVESSVQQPPDQSPSPNTPSNRLSNNQPQSTVSPGGSAGIISPDQGADGNGLTIPSQTNVGGIVGGVMGGFIGIAMISVLLFLCLRRRKKEPFERWQRRMSEKNESDSAPFLDKFKAIPAGIGAAFQKLKGERSESVQNPYRRQSVRSSVSSVYSVRSNGRSRSISEPPSKFRQQLRDFGGRMPSLKRSRTLLGKKQDSLVNGSKSPFPGIVEDPVIRNSKENPFADPEPLEPPRNLRLLNPDPSSGASTPRPQQKVTVEGLQDQQRAPISPKTVARPERASRDPFASILDELEDRNGSGTPEWLRETSHKRTQSATTALSSHPPSSFYTASVYTTADNPFLDPTDAPSVPPLPALPPNPPRRPSNAYTGLGAFNPIASNASRESNTSIFFGEPGPSRPTTNMFSSVAPTPRFGRQSDPFDLDRPEVLGFGNVSGRKEVRASVTRQNSKSNRRSSVPNWVVLDDGPYERASAVPGPLRNPSVRR